MLLHLLLPFVNGIQYSNHFAMCSIHCLSLKDYSCASCVLLLDIFKHFNTLSVIL
jgi:hypothetical protein